MCRRLLRVVQRSPGPPPATEGCYALVSPARLPPHPTDAHRRGCRHRLIGRRSGGGRPGPCVRHHCVRRRYQACGSRIRRLHGRGTHAASLPEGSDTSPARPLRTIGRAQDRVRPMNQDMTGDITAELMSGTCRLAQPVAPGACESGSNDYNAIWTALSGARPVLSGAEQISGWHLADPGRGIWAPAAPQGLSRRQLYVNGVRAQRASGAGGQDGDPGHPARPQQRRRRLGQPVAAHLRDKDQLGMEAST